MAEQDEGVVIIEHRTGGSFGTFVWGLLLGAAGALLFAPKSGRETREELAESVNRLRDEAEDRIRDVQDSVTDAVEDARRQFEEGMDTARRAMEGGRQAVQETRDHAKDAFRAGYEAARSEAGEDPEEEVAPDAPDDETGDEGDPSAG